MSDDDPLGVAQEPIDATERPEPPPSLSWVAPLVQQVARLRTEGVYELLLFVYADGRRGLTVRNARNPHRLERL